MQENNFLSPVLSIVIAVFNEELNIEPLVEELERVLEKLGKTYEIIFVDDGSNDETWKKIRYTAEKNPCIKGIMLTRNFGQQHAVLAGFSCVKGQAVVTMDGDLQHPPSLLPDLLKKWEQGYRVINTCMESTENLSLFKKKTT